MASLLGNSAATQAFTRFGLGGRPDDALPGDPVGWLHDQIVAPDPTPVAGMPTVSDGLAFVAQWAASPSGPIANATLWAGLSPLYALEVQALLANAVLTTAPFRERLVQFWANHFAIMASSFPAIAVAGAYVRDAIRPHATGWFSDMLLAVMQHPAMLYSLNNTFSVGPQSQAAVAAHYPPTLNINENLGRETLELYTVGIGAGYQQADVDALAYLLTGWTVNTTTAPYGFQYRADWAQPGTQTLLGASYPNTQAGCAAALTALATNPATYRHLATKLVTHFVSDTPDPADIDTVTVALARTRGHLGEAARAVIALPSAWRPLSKLRTPQDLVVAALRAANVTAATMPTIGGWVANLGQPVWYPPFPNGWSDLAADWMGPQAMLVRADCLYAMANSLQQNVTAAVAGASALGPLLTANTQTVLGQDASPRDQLTILFCSPEFQRR